MKFSALALDYAENERHRRPAVDRDFAPKVERECEERMEANLATSS